MVRPRLTAELLERNHRFIELLIIVHDDFLVASLADDETSVTPTEVVHIPEGVDG